MADRATAFAPGHFTAFFSVHRHEDPRRTGSRGAGVAVADGVHATVEPGNGTTLNGEQTTIDAVDAVLGTFDASLRVALETDLPLGVGCGVSGAAALSTALAANAVADASLDRPALVSLAHVADVEAGTGLGDVVAQAHGGGSIRVEPGAPPYGRLEPLPVSGRLEFLALGTIPTRAVLAGDTAALSAAGDACLERLLDDPTPATAFGLGRTFAAEADLLDDELETVLEAVEDAGGVGCLGLLGRTVVAPGDGLSRAGYDPTVTSVDRPGARVVDHD